MNAGVAGDSVLAAFPGARVTAVFARVRLVRWPCRRAGTAGSRRVIRCRDRNRCVLDHYRSARLYAPSRRADDENPRARSRVVGHIYLLVSARSGGPCCFFLCAKKYYEMSR